MNAGYAMGGQMEQNAPVQHHVHHSNHAAAAGTDTGDAVMARWLQSAGLQHLAAPLAAAALDHRLLPSLLMQVPSPPSPFFFDWDSGMLAFILCHSTLPSPLLFRVHHPLCVCTASVWISSRFLCFLNYCFPASWGGGAAFEPKLPWAFQIVCHCFS